MITFAPFFKDLKNSKESMSTELKERVDFFDYMNAISKLKDSFYEYNSKKYKFVVQTDDHTDTRGIDAFRTDLSTVPLMGAIVKSNTNFVNKNQGKLILTGADHLICGNVDKFFDEDFDLGFFVHPKKKYVRNSVVLVNSNDANKERIDEFFQRREDFYHASTDEEKKWGADMYSITSALQEKNIIEKYFSDKSNHFFDYNGLKVRVLDYDGKKYIKALSLDKRMVVGADDILIDVKGGAYRKKFFMNAFNQLMVRKDRK
jgi:hypothetical protein